MRKLLFILLLCLTSSASGQFWENPKQKPGLGLQVNWGHPLSKGLVGCWLFNDGSGLQVLDLSGYGKTGTFSAANEVLWTVGKYGPALDLIGSSDSRVDVGNIDAPGNWTISILINKDTVGSQYLVGFEGAGKGIFIINDDLGIYDGTTVNYSDFTETALGVWYHMVVVWDGTNYSYYVDGVNYGSDAGTAVDLTSGVVFGVRGDLIFEFDGKIDYPIIWNRSLSSSEIALLYSKPFCFMEPNWNWNFYIPFLAAPAAGASQVIFIN